MADETYFQPSPVLAALSNPLIVDLIFSHIWNDETQINQIKQFRLVSPLWNNVILNSAPEPVLTLIVNNDNIKGCRDPQVFQEFATTMHPRLARCITLNPMSKHTRRHRDKSDYDCEFEDALEAVGYINLCYCIRNFGFHIHTIDLNNYSEINMKFVPVLHKLFQEYCPNLAEFSICINVNTGEDDEEDDDKPENWDATWKMLDLMPLSTTTWEIPMKSKLNVIGIHLSLFGGIISSDHCREYCQNFLTQLVKAAPNLEHLALWTIDYLDLSRSKKLNKFDFHLPIPEIDYDDNGQLISDYTLGGLTRMLSQIASTLEHLKLTTSHSYCQEFEPDTCSCVGKLGMSVPPLPKLKTLKTSGLDIYFQPGNIVSFKNAIVNSKLHHLEISGQYLEIATSLWLSQVCENHEYSQTPALTVKSLVIDCILDSAVIYLQKLGQILPKLEHLTIQLSIPEEEYNEDAANCQLAHVLNACSVLKLTKFKVKLNLPSNFSILVQVLKNYAALFRNKKLKILKITGTNRLMEVNPKQLSSLIDCFEEAIMSMKDLEKVVLYNCGIDLPLHIGMRIGAFIRKNKLPIIIKNKI